MDWTQTFVSNHQMTVKQYNRYKNGDKGWERTWSRKKHHQNFGRNKVSGLEATD